jgi:hypothetical protein
MCDAIYEMRKLDARWSKARKPHECCACAEAIGVGDVYHVTTLLNASGCRYDRYVKAVKHCARCYAMIEALWKRGVKVVDLESPPDNVAELAFWRPGDALLQTG